jgi:hypothetical protein
MKEGGAAGALRELVGRLHKLLLPAAETRTFPGWSSSTCDIAVA